MCAPLLAVSAAATAASSVMKGVSSLQAGDAEANAAKFNIGVEEANIRNTQERAAFDSGSAGLDAADELAFGQTSLAAGNVAVDTGTAADWRMDVEQALKADRSAIQSEADQQIAGARGRQYLHGRRGRDARRSSRVGFGASVLSGAGRTAFSASEYL